jgi:hypothetical protein
MMVDLSKMTDSEYKVLENRLRRAARRQGLHLEKSRTRDPQALDYGRYWLLDDRNIVVYGHRYRATLDQIAKYLQEPI